MDLRNILGIMVFSSVIASSSAGCTWTPNPNSRNCNYTIVCSTNPGSISNPTCNDEPYVIFIIKNSNLDYLTAALFSATNFDSRVREVIAHGNTWTTIDTSAFRYYSKSIKVDISNNEILKVRNEAFKNLQYIQLLNISYNKIETLYANSFVMAESKSLLELDLSNNHLIELSGELNELPKLKKLHLQNNMLTKLSEDCFMNLKNLEYLNLRSNHLVSLNLTLTNLKMLKTLDLSYNYLKKLSGYEINRMAAIVNFNASHNALTTVDYNCFNQAVSLKVVDFSYNRINATIENIRFVVSSELEYLDFYNNSITGIQENAFINGHLNYLNLINNNITGEIRENTFSGLRNITELDLSRQCISSIKNKAFTQMVNLKHLNLSTNNILEIENASFSNSSIAVLDLSHNKVTHLNFLQNCLVNLTELYLNNNNITVVSESSFDAQTQMKKLDLSMNGIKIIEQYSLPLQNLQYLNIVGNALAGTIKENVFSPAKFLRFLDLSNFNISRIENFAFVDLTGLARLNLSNNQIETIEPNNFIGVDNMYSLDLSSNRLTNLSINSTFLNNLKALYINDNFLTNISGLFKKKSKLLYLDVSNNKITNLSTVGANIFPNITVLRASNNKMKTFNNDNTNTLTTLIDLRLASNDISDINLSYYKELMAVDLSNNNLTHLNMSLFKNNEFLQSLDVSRNNISDLPPGTFQFMKNLKVLNMSSNFLSRLRFGSLKGLHKTEVLDLSKNNIAVLDVDVFHECDELRTLIIDYNRIKTFDLERLILISLKKLRSLSLGGNPISCKEIVHNIKSANDTFYAIRQVEVTSIHKIYHEDNVHGIKCGDEAYLNENTTTKPEVKKSTDEPAASNSSTSIVLIWCSILTIILVAAGVLAYIKLYKKRVVIIGNNVSMNMRNSIVSEVSDFQSDLLG
ncbi:chaoptin-like [Helicoverpa zea]|uniref:chaoptin-like n=1 Tax=Helicoverpa zea TaxID=7113 RepID=UPI001F5A3982|nr:chaoptin-like [Helicoverpa zea]